jgi:hypothetical protein
LRRGELSFSRERPLVVVLTQLDSPDKGFIPLKTRFKSSRAHGRGRYMRRRKFDGSRSKPPGTGRVISRRGPTANSPVAYRKGRASRRCRAMHPNCRAAANCSRPCSRNTCCRDFRPAGLRSRSPGHGSLEPVRL